jgi:hypothetical protein
MSSDQAKLEIPKLGLDELNLPYFTDVLCNLPTVERVAPKVDRPT